jgi:hypothetical protein
VAAGNTDIISTMSDAGDDQDSMPGSPPGSPVPPSKSRGTKKASETEPISIEANTIVGVYTSLQSMQNDKPAAKGFMLSNGVRQAPVDPNVALSSADTTVIVMVNGLPQSCAIVLNSASELKFAVHPRSVAGKVAGISTSPDKDLKFTAKTPGPARVLEYSEAMHMAMNLAAGHSVLPSRGYNAFAPKTVPQFNLLNNKDEAVKIIDAMGIATFFPDVDVDKLADFMSSSEAVMPKPVRAPKVAKKPSAADCDAAETVVVMPSIEPSTTHVIVNVSPPQMASKIFGGTSCVVLPSGPGVTQVIVPLVPAGSGQTCVSPSFSRVLTSDLRVSIELPSGPNLFGVSVRKTADASQQVIMPTGQLMQGIVCARQLFEIPADLLELVSKIAEALDESSSSEEEDDDDDDDDDDDSPSPPPAKKAPAKPKKRKADEELRQKAKKPKAK